MRGTITKRSVDSLAPPTSGEVILWDDTIAGFGLRVRPSGQKTYMVMYRAGHGRGAPLRKLVIGRHGSPWTPDRARAAAKRLLGQVANGADPAAEKTAQRKAATVAQLARQFLAEHVQAKRKERTALEYRRLIDKTIVPAIGRMKVADVTRADVLKLHHAGRGTPYQANRILAVVSKMLNLAEAWGLRTDGTNPCRHVERYPEEPRERMLSADELARIGDALSRYEANPFVVAAIKLLLFTGARLNEILTLQWNWIDLDRGAIRLPESKTGRKTIYLPAPALAVLDKLPRIKGNPYVIPGQRAHKGLDEDDDRPKHSNPKGEDNTGTHLVNLEKPWRAIRDRATVQAWLDSDDPAVAGLIAQLVGTLERNPTPAEFRAAAREAKIEVPAGVDDVRLHDLRHAFASIGVMGGDSLPIIGKLLGHAQAQTTQRYAHLAADPLRAAASAIADKIDAAISGDSRTKARQSKPGPKATA